MLRNRDNSSKGKVIAIILELSLIMIAVFAGLIANELRISHNNKENTQKVLAYLITEIEANANKVKSIIPYHQSIKDSLNSLSQTIFVSKNKKLTFGDLISAMPKGFRIPRLESTGWQILNDTGAINHISLELAIVLSKVYNQQFFLGSKIDKIGDNFYIASNTNIKEIDNLVIALGFLVNDILIQEEQLSEQYSDIIEELKTASGQNFTEADSTG